MKSQNVWFIIITYQPKQEVLHKLKAVLNKNNVRIIENTPEKNLGYGGAANVGIRYALERGAEWVVVCNQDITITKKSIKMFVKTLDKTQPGVVGPEAGSFDKNRWTTILYTEKEELHKATPCQRPRGGLGELDYISGSFMAIHKNVIEKICYFYEPYFMYYEDVDFSVRARKAGFQVQCLALEEFRHEQDLKKHSPRKEYYLARNHLLFVERNAPWWVKVHEIFRFPKTIYKHLDNKEAFKGIIDYLFRRLN